MVDFPSDLLGLLGMVDFPSDLLGLLGRLSLRLSFSPDHTSNIIISLSNSVAIYYCIGILCRK